MPGTPAVAVGRLGPDGPWVGFSADGAGFHLAYARPGEAITVSPARGAARVAELLAAAIVYFEEALDPPPPETEATQADLARLLAWLATTETDAGRGRLVGEALDAIDDGLAGDVVVARLSDARHGLAPDTTEQADVIDLLAKRWSDLGGRSAAGEAAPSV
jgi:hypothetical protein